MSIAHLLSKSPVSSVRRLASGALAQSARRRRMRIWEKAECLEDRCLLAAALVANVETGAGHVAAFSGLSNVDGRELHVEVMVWVPDGADAHEIGLAALQQQGARPITSAEFSLTGLQWTQFSDEDMGNDFVTQHYRPNNDPFAGAGLGDTHNCAEHVGQRRHLSF
jgi:hypothetical protein